MAGSRVEGISMMVGEIDHTIDSKGRYIIPSIFREDLGESFYLVRGLDNCIFVYPAAKWQKVMDSLSELPMTDPRARRFARKFTSGAFFVTADKQFRVVLPPILREHAKIDKDIVTVGGGTRLEIWSRNEWNIYEAEADDSFEEDASYFPEIKL